jgi:hypothetical protein
VCIPRGARVASGTGDDVLERLGLDGEVHSPEPALVAQGALHDRLQRIVVECLEPEQDAPRHQRGVHLEGRVLGRGADQHHPPVLDRGEERVLLRLVEAMNLVEEQHRPVAPLREPVARRGNHLAYVGNARGHGRHRLEARLGGARDDVREGRLSGPGRAVAPTWPSTMYSSSRTPAMKTSCPRRDAQVARTVVAAGSTSVSTSFTTNRILMQARPPRGVRSWRGEAAPPVARAGGLSPRAAPGPGAGAGWAGARPVPGNRFDDGLLEVAVFDSLWRYALVTAGTRILPGLARWAGVPRYHARAVTLDLPPGTPVQVDGEDCTGRLEGVFSVTFAVRVRLLDLRRSFFALF